MSDIITKEKEQEDPAEMLFNDNWGFFTDSFIGVDKGVSEYTDSAKKIFTITNVAEFWGIFNEMWGTKNKRIDQLEFSKSVHFMRGNATPVYEDAMHARGGILSMVYTDSVPALELAKFNDMWMYLLLALVGNTHEFPESQNQINGVSFSRRKRKLIIRFWDSAYTGEPKEKAALEKHAVSLIDILSHGLTGTYKELFRKPEIYYYKTTV